VRPLLAFPALPCCQRRASYTPAPLLDIAFRAWPIYRFRALIFASSTATRGADCHELRRAFLNRSALNVRTLDESVKLGRVVAPRCGRRPNAADARGESYQREQCWRFASEIYIAPNFRRNSRPEQRNNELPPLGKSAIATCISACADPDAELLGESGLAPYAFVALKLLRLDYRLKYRFKDICPRQPSHPRRHILRSHFRKSRIG